LSSTAGIGSASRTDRLPAGDPPTAGGVSAIIMPVTAAEPLISGWRLRHDPSAASGVPAHVTVVAPFVAPARLTEELIMELGALFAARAAPRVRFARMARFAPAGEAAGVLYLAPEPADELRALTQAVVARWPEAPPYGGLHAEIVPHLTVAIAGEAALDAIERELSGALGTGFAATLDRAEVYVHAGERWRRVASLPLGAGRP
jgi:2'-5' RNA ligase